MWSGTESLVYKDEYEMGPALKEFTVEWQTNKLLIFKVVYPVVRAYINKLQISYKGGQD